VNPEAAYVKMFYRLEREWLDLFGGKLSCEYPVPEASNHDDPGF